MPDLSKYKMGKTKDLSKYKLDKLSKTKDLSKYKMHPTVPSETTISPSGKSKSFIEKLARTKTGYIPEPIQSVFALPEEEKIKPELTGATIPEKLAKSTNPLVRSFGTSMKQGGILGLLAPLQWAMSSVLGLGREFKKRDIQRAQKEYEETGKIPERLLAPGKGITREYVSPEKLEEEEERAKKIFELPIAKEKPKSYWESVKESVGKSYWAGEFYKELGAPEGASAVVGLATELTVDPLNYINVTTIPRALANISDNTLKSTKFYDWTKDILTNKLKIDLMIKQGDKFEELKTAYKADWLRQNSTEWLATLDRVKDIKKAEEYFNLNELAELNAIQKLDPELIDAITNLNVADKTKFGLTAGKKVLVSEEKLAKTANKVGIPYLSDKIRKSLFGKAFIKYGDLDLESAEYLKQLPRFKNATLNELEKVIQPELAKIATKDLDNITLLNYGEDVLKDYLKFKGVDDVLATAEVNRITKQYPNFSNNLQEYWQQLAKIDHAYEIEYNEINKYMASYINQAYKGKRKIPTLSLNKMKEWYQNPKIYENPLQALEAGENPILNINDIVRVRTQATVNAIYRRIGLDTFDAMYSSTEAQKGYKLVKSKYMGNKYFPERIANALNAEEEYISLGNVMDKIMDGVRWVSGKWKGLVTYHMPTFHMTNLKGGTEIDLIDYGIEAVNPKNMQVGWDIWRNKNLDKIIESDNGVKYSQRVLKWFMDSMGAGSGFTRSILSNNKMAKWDLWGLKGAQAGEDIEGFMRSRSWWLAFKQTDDPVFATMKTFINHFDYNSLTGFEKSFINPFFAFWTFRKNIMGRTAELMLTKPGRYGQLLDVLKGIQQTAGGREPEKEPSWFFGAPHIKIPVEYKGNNIYIDVQELPIHALELPEAVIGAMEAKTEPDKNLWTELFKPITQSIYPWWKIGLQRLTNRDMFLNREIIPTWAKGDPSYRVPADSGWVAYLPKVIKKEMGVEYQYIKGKKRLMIKPQWNDMLKAFPLNYQVRALFSSVTYADYEEKQKLLDIFYYLTGITHPRAIDDKYYLQRYQKTKEIKQKTAIEQYLYELQEEHKKR